MVIQLFLQRELVMKSLKLDLETGCCLEQIFLLRIGLKVQIMDMKYWKKIYHQAIVTQLKNSKNLTGIVIVKE